MLADVLTKPCLVRVFLMPRDPVLLEARPPFASAARELLLAAHFEPVIELPAYRKVHRILHQLSPSVYKARRAGTIEQTVARMQKEVAETKERHRHGIIAFWAPDMPEKQYVEILNELTRPRMPKPVPHFDLYINVSAVVARFLREKSVGQASAESFVLDQIPKIDTLGDDLRDNATGKLDAKKVSELFKIKLPSLADAVGVSRQALDENPVSEKAQPLLRLFERIARLRAHPQLSDSASLRKWFQKPLPVFSGRSAFELFQAGNLELVASKVDQLLMGDFGG
jgi:hypothetical protein